MSGVTYGTERVARVCHEANRAWCESCGDFSQQSWEDAPVWQRESAVEGVEVALADGTPSTQHEAWREQREMEGWRYGETKDAAVKTHPCLVPFADLPPAQQTKDALFIAVARALTSTVCEEQEA